MTKERFWKLSPVVLFLVLVYLTYTGFNEANLRTLQFSVMTAFPAVIGITMLRLSPAILILGSGTVFGLYHLLDLSGMHQSMTGEASVSALQWLLLLFVPVVPTMYWSFCIDTLYDVAKQPDKASEK
ncbi:hypothetical protein ACU8KO_002599 [Vibrio alginolyticus]